MDGAGPARLVCSEIHGFHTMRDLDVQAMWEEAKTRWLRPNEIHAILCNHKYFTIHVKPMNLPKSGTLVLFDRKMLRNFRKDGHNWKKKKDGKTVKEAHEHLKVGNEERIHVYYAHGEDNPTFVRRCYWLLDKTLEHIVLVHYRETQEVVQTSPATPGNSNTSSVSDHSSPLLVTEDIDSSVGNARYPERCNSQSIRNHEIRLHEINTLEWEELLASSDVNNQSAPTVDDMSFTQQQQMAAKTSVKDGNQIACYNFPTDMNSLPSLGGPSYQNNSLCDPGSFSSQHPSYGIDPNVQQRNSSAVAADESLDVLLNNGLQSQESFGRWVNSIVSDSPGSVDDPPLETTLSPGKDLLAAPTAFHSQSNIPEQIFSISDVSPTWAYSTERTKILVTGFFHEGYQHLGRSNLFCFCGDICVPAEILQVGVYRCFLSPQSPRVVNLYMSADGQKPISQSFSFELRSAPVPEKIVTRVDQPKWEELEFQLRLAHLLFSSSNMFNVLSSKVSPDSRQEAKKFANKTSHLSNDWASVLLKSIQLNQISFGQAKDSLFELTLKNKLKEWLFEKVLEGRKVSEFDSKGLGVIHLCAILGYTWSIRLFSYSGLSLNFRDKHGWTALHWAAYHGREKMVAALLSAGARPNLVTDPTKENPGGYTAADLAAKMGYEGLSAYLSEKSLVAQFKDMKVAGNISGNLQACKAETSNPGNLTEDEQNLKDTLASYRLAAEAASRIQVAFREHSLKVQSKAVRFASQEEEARNIIAALKIQHAFRNFETRKRMVAAARIQHRFLAWRMRRHFLNMRRQAIRIQAVFRGFQVRKQYRKIVWSVGVLEKAILRWRLKRRGFRGLQVKPAGNEETSQGSDAEEDFYKASQKQAEDRLERSVVCIQTMFRSKKAQQEYRRMKLAHEEAQLEYDGLQELDQIAMELES